MMKKSTAIPHIYQDYAGPHIWRVIEDSIDFLLKEDDIDIHSRKEYLVGRLCQEVTCDQQAVVPPTKEITKRDQLTEEINRNRLIPWITLTIKNFICQKNDAMEYHKKLLSENKYSKA